VDAVIEELTLPVRFAKAVSAEARSLKEKDFGPRRDLRALQTVTIDGESAKDFDDAVSIERREAGGYTLWVHIADVGHYVPWDSQLDMEARERGTSVYFPDRVIPMLPKELSEDLCSLKPGLDRPAFTVEMQMSQRGRRSSAKFYKSLIRSDERMTYTSVRKIAVDLDEPERARYERLLPEIDLMAELAGLMRQARLGRGSLDFDLPEPEIVLDMQGRPEAILRAERSFAHMIIEEFMIAANEAVAEHLTSRSLPCLYRVHEAPDISRVEEVYRFAGLLGMPRKLIPPPGASTASFHRLLAAAKGMPEEELLNYLVLRTLKQARYSEYNAGHFGLASRCYLHFTSPIRRYPDLVCHRILDEALSGKGSPERLEGLLPEIASQSSRRERTAMDAERAVIEAMRAWFMKDKVGEVFPATIIGVTQAGLRVRLEEYYVEGFIKVSDMMDDYYNYDERSASLKGRHSGKSFRFGRRVHVRLDNVDMEARALLFGLALKPGGAEKI
jgi:ribonuclease R